MKKTILLLIASLTFGMAQAQERVLNRGTINHRDGDGEAAPKYNNSGFGIKGGVLFNSLRGDGTDAMPGLKTATNWHAGFYSQFSLSGVFSVQPEILYSRKESKMDAGTMRFDYIEIPVMGVFNFSDNVSIHAGPQAGVLMAVKENDKEIDKAQFNSFDFGAAAGVEARLSFFRLGARYYLSLANMAETEDADAATYRAYDNIKAGNFQVYLGVGF
ncbi:porin family protein [Nibribacter koreensis]|uniref:Outer membrane protein beta-barrel domain-containing protein n=1 Tax=Nibribacter koreensis TaxID=1084519 RepID=A0ABP8FLH7_9BACT